MSYSPQSNNPYITPLMLKKGLFDVLIERGPDSCQKYIEKRYSGKLIFDDIRNKILFVFGMDNEILVEINIADISSIACLDACEEKENRHHVQIVTKYTELNIYEFYINIPYQCDPMPFIYRIQNKINLIKTPREKYVKKNKIGAYGGLIACVVFTFLSIGLFSTGEYIGCGILTLLFSICCGVVTKEFFDSLK